MISLNKENFKQEISEGVSFVDFWGNNCQKCLQFMDGIEQLSQKYSENMKFFKFNVDEDKMFSIKEKVMGLPTIIIYENGVQKSRLMPNNINSLNDIEEFIKKNI
ncbi:thioredoxin family protein [Candidatus Arthromitus sp. SFB-turkey]|uniref:thioredoxin family protein n=1 Tax=Candidatus Arthromitus sp. SFB-turkey TaxID=1840217 RepID=UPI0007F3A698|nr:thioredoxin family protein [Candidatus Arthromitus sp. SFB-turkey]OAT87168.1 hypothetical protein A6P36_06930 [Candidatus Arthromitus sp. SFB-turkey]HJD00355.1 thioredoxin family protein [Candidatus Dwaynia gallinarum]